MKVLHSLIFGLRAANSVLAQRLAFPLLFLGAGLVLAQPSAAAPFVFEATGSLANARYRHTETLLPNGKVLVAGGVNDAEVFLASAELYDPASGTWTATGSLNIARAAHTATLLPNGQVLVACGYGGAGTGRLVTARIGPTATLLLNGKVLVAGGSAPGSILASAELYDPATGTWTAYRQP